MFQGARNKNRYPAANIQMGDSNMLQNELNHYKSKLPSLNLPCLLVKDHVFFQSRYVGQISPLLGVIAVTCIDCNKVIIPHHTFILHSSPTTSLIIQYHSSSFITRPFLSLPFQPSFDLHHPALLSGHAVV